MRIVVALALLVAGPALAGLDLTAPEPYAVGQTTVTWTAPGSVDG
jgi:hypothetical protein